jgi:hypothetical protein
VKKRQKKNMNTFTALLLLGCVGFAHGAGLRAAGCDCECGACPVVKLEVCGCPAIAKAPPKMVPVGTFSGKCECGQPAQPASCGCGSTPVTMVPAPSCDCTVASPAPSCGCEAPKVMVPTTTTKCNCECGSCPVTMISVCGCPAIAKAPPKMVPVGTFSGKCECGQPAQPVSCGCSDGTVSVPTVTVQGVLKA